MEDQIRRSIGPGISLRTRLRVVQQARQEDEGKRNAGMGEQNYLGCQQWAVQTE